MFRVFKVKLKIYLQIILRPFGRYNFLKKYSQIIRNFKNKKVKILDIGCGNESPYKVKQLLKSCFYVGVDIEIFNTKLPDFADDLILSSPEDFSTTVSNLKDDFDLAVCSHNLEHCNDWASTLKNICKKIKKNGYLYLAFPCEDSIYFPSRKGTLNFFDDKTHNYNRPNLIALESILDENNMKVLKKIKNSTPPFLFLLGMILEPLSAKFNKVLPGTWEYWGFETVLHCKKI